MFSGTPFAQDNPAEWNKAWTKFQTVHVQETAGFNRTHEPVEAEIKFYQPMPGKDVKGIESAVRKGVRVIHKTAGGQWEEIPSQVYDIRPYDWNRRAQTPEIMVRARVAFFADVPANMTGTYHIAYGNSRC